MVMSTNDIEWKREVIVKWELRNSIELNYVNGNQFDSDKYES